MMRAHGIAPNAATIKPAPSSRTPKIERESSTATVKKRKADAFLEDTTPVDDDEVFGNGGNIKNEVGKEKFVVKEESEMGMGMGMGQGMGQGALSIDQAANLMQYYDSPASATGFAGPSALRGFAANEYGGSGYGASMPTSYALPSQQQYDFSTSYGAGGMGAGLGSGGMNSTMSSGGMTSTGMSTNNMGTGNMSSSGMRASTSNTSGMSNVPRNENQGLRYQPMMNYQGDTQGQGHSDSPVIVE